MPSEDFKKISRIAWLLQEDWQKRNLGPLPVKRWLHHAATLAYYEALGYDYEELQREAKAKRPTHAEFMETVKLLNEPRNDQTNKQ